MDGSHQVSATGQHVVRDHEWKENVEHAVEICIVSFGSLAGEWVDGAP